MLIFKKPVPPEVVARPERPFGGSITILQVSPQARKIPLSYNKHIRGWHYVRPGHGSIPWEGLGEYRFISLMARLKDMEGIQSQPVTIHYSVDGGPATRYTPDFLVTLTNVPPFLARLGFDHQTLVEYKPSDRAKRRMDDIERAFAAVERANQPPILLLTELHLDVIEAELEAHLGY